MSPCPEALRKRAIPPPVTASNHLPRKVPRPPAGQEPKTAHTWKRREPQKAWQEPPGVNESEQVGRWDVGKGKARAALSARKCHQRYMAICPV